MFENYRPISILSAISKILEKTIFNQLHAYFQDNKLYCKNQYGFRRNHSTEYAALELIDRVILDMDKSEIPFSIFIDLSKAFDTLDHNILINKLQYYGIKDTALDLFQSYLSNRRQYVQIGNNKSDTTAITTGVPQGSILGPQLFIIYINDIIKFSTLFHTIIYADDTTLVGKFRDFKICNGHSLSENINYEITNLIDWLNVNRLGVRSLASRARQFNPLNPPGVGWVKFCFFKVRVSIRTCVPNLGAIRRERFLTIYNPLNLPPGVGWVKFF